MMTETVCACRCSSSRFSLSSWRESSSARRGSSAELSAPRRACAGKWCGHSGVCITLLVTMPRNTPLGSCTSRPPELPLCTAAVLHRRAGVVVPAVAALAAEPEAAEESTRSRTTLLSMPAVTVGSSADAGEKSACPMTSTLLPTAGRSSQGEGNAVGDSAAGWNETG